MLHDDIHFLMRDTMRMPKKMIFTAADKLGMAMPPAGAIRVYYAMVTIITRRRRYFDKARCADAM